MTSQPQPRQNRLDWRSATPDLLPHLPISKSLVWSREGSFITHPTRSREMAAAVSPFARSSAFEETLLSAREQTVRLRSLFGPHFSRDVMTLYLIKLLICLRLKRCIASQRASLRSKFETLRRMVSHHRCISWLLRRIIDNNSALSTGFGRKMYTDYEIICKVRHGIF